MIRSAQDLLDELSNRHPVPLSALVETTRRCNERCVHCFQVGPVVPELATEDWRLVFGRLADAGVLFLTVTGGEPTVREDWIELLKIARGLGFSPKLKTNALRLDDAGCDAIAGVPVFTVFLSLYSGRAEIHDRITCVEGSHARVLAAARRLRRNGIRVVLACPVMRENADTYQSLVEFASSEDMRFTFDTDITVQEDGCAEPARHRVSEDSYLRLLSDPRIYEPKEPGPVEEKLEQPVCRIGKAMVAVAPNGDVWPCLSIQEKMGNLLEQDLKSIWIGNPILEKYASIRWKDLPTCRKCELLPYCNRCHANAMREDGDLYGPSRLACQRARLMREVTERRLRGGKSR